MAPVVTVSVACTCGRGAGAIHRDDCPVSIVRDVLAEIRRQDDNYGPFIGDPSPRSRLALACLEDETAEAIESWRNERHDSGWIETRGEVMQAAAVAIRAMRDAF